MTINSTETFIHPSSTICPTHFSNAPHKIPQNLCSIHRQPHTQNCRYLSYKQTYSMYQLHKLDIFCTTAHLYACNNHCPSTSAAKTGDIKKQKDLPPLIFISTSPPPPPHHQTIGARASIQIDKMKDLTSYQKSSPVTHTPHWGTLLQKPYT